MMARFALYELAPVGEADHWNALVEQATTDDADQPARRLYTEDDVAAFVAWLTGEADPDARTIIVAALDAYVERRIREDGVEVGEEHRAPEGGPLRYPLVVRDRRVGATYWAPTESWFKTTRRPRGEVGDPRD